MHRLGSWLLLPYSGGEDPVPLAPGACWPERGGMSGRRIELSVTQVTSSVLATVTGAIVASSLGVTGTVIGVAVVSFATTAGTTVYRHYLGRTQERLRS